MAAVASLVVFAATPAPISRRGGRATPLAARRSVAARATYGPVGEAIERKIADELSPEVLVVNDDSEKHATHKGLHDGHAGVRSNESHFSVTVVAEAFAGMTHQAPPYGERYPPGATTASTRFSSPPRPPRSGPRPTRNRTSE